MRIDFGNKTIHPLEMPLREIKDAVEKAWVEQAMRRTGGNQTRAAILAGISRRSLIQKLEKYGMKTKPKKRGSKKCKRNHQV